MCSTGDAQRTVSELIEKSIRVWYEASAPDCAPDIDLLVTKQQTKTSYN